MVSTIFPSAREEKNRGYTYLCAGSVICVSPLQAPQFSIFACCLIPVLTLVVLLVVLDDISTRFPLAREDKTVKNEGDTHTCSSALTH